MSIHLMVVAAYLPEDVVTQSQKLAMMKICDSADDETRLSKPGLRRLRAWIGVGEKRCMTIVTELVAKGLIERVETGKAGRRAVYRVFPLGVPPIPSNDDLEARFKEADAAPKNPRLARPGVARAAPSKPARTHEDIDARALAAGAGVKRAGFPRGNPEESDGRVPPGEPTGLPPGNPLGSPRGTPSFPSSSSFLPSPPYPRGWRSHGGARWLRQTPRPGCELPCLRHQPARCSRGQ
ncbi:helix-turn-helix domain-containing protein [Streptomyces rhizosphaerihabitans]|uniref:helix-turn-helix domain-containing protein n=1 Tax=Streptomyces rhizosphaerihabitans TaxID=1266770 RepID=UPI0021C05372|nr:helix-turn-helix domain-containing protein [Streptomyces rhizosphaerihabitans]MCT9003514.1 helix-turn-helix domain-containing protein [Streptomyces rhizosphaerihabitans]